MELSLEKIKSDMNISKKDLISYGVDHAEQILRKKIDEATVKTKDLQKKHSDARKELKKLIKDEAIKSCKDGIDGLQKGIDYFFKGSTIDIQHIEPDPDSEKFFCSIIVNFKTIGESRGPRELFELTQRGWGRHPHVMHIPHVFELADRSKYEAASTLRNKYWDEYQKALDYLHKLSARLQNIGNIERHLKAQLTYTVLEASTEGKEILKKINETIEKQIGDIK